MLKKNTINWPNARGELVARAERPTWSGAVVSDEAGHVDGFAVDGQVSHAAHEVPVPDREVLGEVGNSAEQQRAGQIQWSAERNS